MINSGAPRDVLGIEGGRPGCEDQLAWLWWVPESEFLKAATKEAKHTLNQWALNHLPRLVLDQEVTFGLDSTNGKVTCLFKDADFANGEYKYEERTLRITVQERLYPLTALTSVKDVGQVLLDIGCGTYLH